mgnify:CR=1 FL=1|tara:strand:- start:1974 stop:2615 length:642 start_codon:yes stop_codon:yes gene_type:complete
MQKWHIIFLTFSLLLISGCGNSSKDNSIKKLAKSSVKIEAGSYKMDIENSLIKWTGREVSTKSHYGTLRMKQGDMNINGNGSINGRIDIDMSSIDCEDLEGRGKKSLERHLRSDDFFNVETFPIATLIFTSDGNLNKANQLSFTGDLTIKGSTHPIAFLAEINNNDQKLEAIANMSFDRSKYNVRFRSGTFFQNLGDKLIYDEIEMAVSILTQ